MTVYVFQEPSLLSSLQDNGLTDVVLNALLVKDVSIYSCLKITEIVNCRLIVLKKVTQIHELQK